MLFTSFHDLVVKTERTMFERTKEHVPAAKLADTLIIAQTWNIYFPRII